MDNEPTNLLEALYIALDRLEALDPTATSEPWYQLIEREADVAAQFDLAKLGKDRRH